MVRKDTSGERDYHPPTKSTSRRRSRTWAEHQTSSLRKALLTNKKKRAEKADANKDDINVPYYEEFCRHVEDVRGYLHGRWEEEQDIEEEEGGEGLLKNPLFDAHWTETEKNAFFHALSTCSRLRPDLIASNVKTKSVFQVCIYLRALEQTLEEFAAGIAGDLVEDDDEENHDGSSMPDGVPVEQQQGNEEEPIRAGQKRKRGSYPSRDSLSLQVEHDPLERRKTYPIAHEMSNDWVDFEERLAKVVSRFEEQCGGYVGPMSEDRGRKKRKIDNEEEDGSEVGEEGVDDQDQEDEDEDEEQEGEEATLQTSGLYFLNNQLQALDNILRESEDASAHLEIIPSPSKSQRSSSEPTSNSKSSVEGAARGSEDDSLDEDDIDSYIRPLASSQHAPRSQTPSSSSSEGKETETTPAPTSVTNMLQLSPVSRRRLQKRLYMRKQRALKKGLTEEGVDVKSVRLKSGPKAKGKGKEDEEVSSPRKKEKSAKDEDEDEDDDEDEAEQDELDDEEEEEEEEENGSKTPTGRTTESFKYKQEFLEAGIDADVINTEGLGYFNLGAMGKLMNFFSSGYADRTIPGSPSLSADLIRIVLGILCEFTTDLVHRSILLCESESKARDRTKVWRQRSTRQKDNASDNGSSELRAEYIRPDDVKLALETMGFKFEERKIYLGRIMALDATEEDLVSKTLVGRGGGGLPALSPHQALYGPFVHLPQEYRPLDERVRSQASDSSSSASPTVPQRETRRDDEEDSDEEEEGEGQEEDGQEVAQEDDALELDHDSDTMMDGEMHEDTDDDDSLLPFLPTPSEDEEFRRQLLEEDELDELDMMETKDYEKEAWDRTLVPA
ncbi:hypothetical protein EST38_g9131 [Candolleomyces aberdarensis]|uniref:Uncharacterized protein n=1 Tax=Candolleomyces aberdarensis TaxID=2316362 RepID=A0A4Q2DDX8_9AGAR|nr:hypothetical protein EST38_g9131 [Candolleomyces aberdarensis]